MEYNNITNTDTSIAGVTTPEGAKLPIRGANNIRCLVCTGYLKERLKQWDLGSIYNSSYKPCTVTLLFSDMSKLDSFIIKFNMYLNGINIAHLSLDKSNVKIQGKQVSYYFGNMALPKGTVIIFGANEDIELLYIFGELVVDNVGIEASDVGVNNDTYEALPSYGGITIPSLPNGADLATAEIQDTYDSPPLIIPIMYPFRVPTYITVSAIGVYFDNPLTNADNIRLHLLNSNDQELPDKELRSYVQLSPDYGGLIFADYSVALSPSLLYWVYVYVNAGTSETYLQSSESINYFPSSLAFDTSVQRVFEYTGGVISNGVNSAYLQYSSQKPPQVFLLTD